MNFEELYRLTSKKPKDKAENGNILGIKSRKNLRRFSFVVRCLESYSNPKGHIASVIFPEVVFKLADQQWYIPVQEEILLKCSCPAFLYYGSAFYASQFGYHIDGNVENRPPVIRDPESNRYLCKHLIRVYKYLEKTSFESLLKRFHLASKQLKMATIEQDILPAIADYLTRINIPDEEIKEVLGSLSFENCEEIMEHYGVVISDQPSQYDIVKDKHPIDSLLEKEILE